MSQKHPMAGEKRFAKQPLMTGRNAVYIDGKVNFMAQFSQAKSNVHEA